MTITFLIVFLSQLYLAWSIPKNEKRQSGSLNFCWGENAVCAVQDLLYNECSTFQSPYNGPKYYNCICSNGYVSLEEACNFCQVFYNISNIINNVDLDKSACQSYSVSIAPVPSSILAIESEYNSTYTSGPGVVTKATTQYGGGPAATTPTSTSSVLPSSTAASMGGVMGVDDVLAMSAILSGIWFCT